MPPEAPPVLRAAFEASGSGAWLMRTVIECRLDHAHGFRLMLSLGDDRVRGDRQATEARLIGGQVDVIDTDWLSLARHRDAGLPLVAMAPYGAIFGALVARGEDGPDSLEALPGRRIGFVHAADKNWLLLRAACRERGFDPARDCLPRACGSKSALLAEFAAGRLDAALLYWHQVPSLLARGDARELCDLLELLPAEGGRAVPSTFFACTEALLAARPEAVAGFARAVDAASTLLRGDASLWQRMSGAEGRVGDALREKWLARVGLPWHPAMTTALQALARRLAVRETLPDGLFAAALTH